MPAQTPQTYVIPSSVLKAAALVSPSTQKTSFTNLAAAASVTIGTFLIDFSQIFDRYVFMDQACTLQPQIRRATSGSGSTWRSYKPAYVGVASVILDVIALRLPNSLAQFVITNTGAVATTTLEIVLTQRSA